jgi:hypothetical protein
MATAEPVLDCRELRRRAPQQVDQQPGAVQRAAGPLGTPELERDGDAVAGRGPEHGGADQAEGRRPAG